MPDTPEFKSAGATIRRKRKESGYKTQKAFIAALKTVDPDISCSESYISLIEKGVKTPGVHLLDVMAEVMSLSPTEKGELLLTYKRVPSDFEFAVRDNLKAAAEPSRLDRIRSHYENNPGRDSFNHYLKSLILEEQDQAAIALLKQAPTFENEILELQERTAKMASLSGNYDFAVQAFELALNNVKAPKHHAEILLNIGTLHFQQGLKIEKKEPHQALNFYLKAHDLFEKSLALMPDELFTIDEHGRCAYHIGDTLLFIYKQKQIQSANAKTQPELAAAYQKWFGKKVSLKGLEQISAQYFEQAKIGYQKVLDRADNSPLPDKPMQEAVFFHAYVHAKLKLFSMARVLIHSNLLLERNWLTYFMKAGLGVMEYEHSAQEVHLDQAMQALTKALGFDKDSVLYLLRYERDRELKALWKAREEAMEALIKDHDE